MMELEELKERVLRHQLAQKEMGWLVAFDDRQRGLIGNCRTYTANQPSGLPGHNLMVIIERMAAMLDAALEQGYRP